jgi:hypothetical protein
MWLYYAFSLVLAVITARYIWNYTHKSHISSVTTNIKAVSLSVSLNTQLRSAPLRAFFCWVRYSVAISTVYQAYLTTFLIEPGYKEPIKNVTQMLASKMKFSFFEIYEKYFTYTFESTKSTVLKNVVGCPIFL